jgi:hypothetical protein
MYLKENRQANQGISKYKLLSAYGGAGSLMHTEYGSILISCIEEWGFIKVIESIFKEEQGLSRADEVHDRTFKRASLLGIKVSDDKRFLELIKTAKRLNNLEALVLVPDLEVDEVFNTIVDNKDQAISSTFFPKAFLSKEKFLKYYHEWHFEWEKKNKRNTQDFFPPKYLKDGKEELLLQDNLALICENGHISDFPWSKFLSWKRSNPKTGSIFDPNHVTNCCNKPLIRITENQGNVTGYEGKYLSCEGGCKGNEGVTLKGLFGLKIACTGQKPWEVNTGTGNSYFGDNKTRGQNPPTEKCNNKSGMKVALTTGNNLYFSRNISGIYIPEILTRNYSEELLNELHKKKNELLLTDIDIETAKSQAIEHIGSALNTAENKPFNESLYWERTIDKFLEEKDTDDDSIIMREYDRRLRHQEYKVFCTANENEINIEPRSLLIKDVTDNLTAELRPYFSKILRLDNLKLTTTQLDFTRVLPLDSDLAENEISPKNIFRSENRFVTFYPAIESFGEGIFFAFNKELLTHFSFPQEIDEHAHSSLNWHNHGVNRMSKSAVQTAISLNAALYAVHTFSHLIMRELEFSCGYPTSSLSERLYVSKETDNEMYGVLIMTTEGTEGSMGGLIAQTKESALNVLINKALYRATLCSSDPLCWDSEGQGLFDLNLAACFSCGLVSETSCELRNIHLDRRILVDEVFGLFRDIIMQ